VIEILFGSRTRASILRLLLLGEQRSYRLLELVRAVGTSTSSVQAELKRLEDLGLVRSHRTADARVISANDAHPFAAPLRELLLVSESAEQSSTDTAILEKLNPAVRPYADRIAAAGVRFGALKVALVGSATQVDSAIAPADLDVLVRLDPNPVGYAERYFGLRAELETIMGMPVDIIEEDALTSPYLAAEFAATQVVLYEAAGRCVAHADEKATELS